MRIISITILADIRRTTGHTPVMSGVLSPDEAAWNVYNECNKRTCDLDVLKRLVKVQGNAPPYRASGSSRYAAAYYAIKSNNYEAAYFLLSQPQYESQAAQVVYGECEKTTAYADVVERLVGAQGKAPPYRHHDGWTAVSWAAQHGKCKILSILVRNPVYGKYVDHPNNYGFTPIIIAAHHGHLGCVEELYHRGGSLIHQTNEGASALHFAATSYGRCVGPLVMGVLRLGADIHLLNLRGEAPLDLARYQARHHPAAVAVVNTLEEAEQVNFCARSPGASRPPL